MIHDVLGGRRGAVLGGLSGLALGLLETLCRYLPAVAGTDLLPLPWSPLLATAAYVALATAAGAVHVALGPIALLAVAAATADLDPVGLLAVPAAVGLGWLAERRPTLAWSGIAGAALGFALLPRGAPIAEGEPERPDLALIVLDTVAAGDTSLHGADLDTTPTLTALAAEGVHWSQALAPAPWTVPSHAALFTGQPARTTGAHHEHPVLAPGLPTLAERLDGLGYRTGAFVANPWLARSTGITRGFAHRVGVWDLDARQGAFAALRLLERLWGAPRGKGGGALVEHALAWLERGGDRPSFVFLNLLEAHAPYHEVPDPGRFGIADAEVLSERVYQAQLYGADALDFPQPGERAAARALYAGAVRAADDLLADFVEGLRRRGRLDRTLLMVTSDHGEAFGEHGFTGHVIGLYENILHVPLVMRHPEFAWGGAEHPELVEVTRVYDTLLEVASDESFERSLFAGGADAFVVSEQRRPVRTLARFRGFDERDLSPLDTRALRVRSADLALLRETPGAGGQPSFSLFDLASDPGERQPLRPDPRADVLLQRMAEFDALEVHGGPDPFFDDDFRERLEALGYLTPGG